MKSKDKSGKTKMNKDQAGKFLKEMSDDQSASVEFKDMCITKTHDIYGLFGFRHEELAGVSIHVLFPELQDDEIPTKSRLSEILSDFNDDSTTTFDLKFQHRYGHIFKETVQLKSVGKDTFTFVFSLKLQEMTDQMLENLAREDPSIADYIHQTPVLIRMSNDKNQFYYFSKHWLNFTGSTLKEEVNGGWLDHIFPEDTQNVKDTLQNAFNNKSKYNLSYRLVGYDNQQSWMYESGIPIFDNDGDFIGHLAVSLNISRIKGAEELIENESTFKILAEHAPVLFRMTDEHNSEYYFSKQWLQFTGKGIKEETNQEWTKNIHSEDYLYVNEKLQFSLANSKKYEITYRLQNKAGEYRWMFETGIPIFGHMGRYTGFISAAIDVSDRKIAEEKETKKQAFLESEKKLQASLNYSNLISLTVDNHKHISYCNDYFVELMGLEKEEIIGQEVYTYLEFMDAEGRGYI
jgi:PAS domain S-box-containing protein